MHKITKKILKNRKALLITVALAATIITFTSVLLIAYDKLIIGLTFSILLFLIGAASGPVSVRLFGYYHVGFDLIPFATIIYFYQYGFMTGLMAAIGMNALSCIATKQFAIGHIVEIIGYAFIGVLAFFVNINPFMNGMILVICWNLFVYLVFYFIRIASPNEWIRIIGNLLLHFVLFRYFSTIVFKII